MYLINTFPNLINSSICNDYELKNIDWIHIFLVHFFFDLQFDKFIVSFGSSVSEELPGGSDFIDHV